MRIRRAPYQPPNLRAQGGSMGRARRPSPSRSAHPTKRLKILCWRSQKTGLIPLCTDENFVTGGHILPQCGNGLHGMEYSRSGMIAPEHLPFLSRLYARMISPSAIGRGMRHGRCHLFCERAEMSCFGPSHGRHTEKCRIGALSGHVQSLREHQIQFGRDATTGTPVAHR